MKIPKMLDDYLEETEQDAASMTAVDLFEEASWVLSQHEAGDYYPGEYTKKDIAALRLFISKITGYPPEARPAGRR